MVEQIRDDKKYTGVRLPATVRPKHYDLTLKPDLTNFTFDGSVRIKYEGEQVQEIVLNTKEIEISDGRIVGTDCRLSRVIYSESSEATTLVFNVDPPTQGILEIKYKGILNDKLKGFYRTAFKLDGELIHAATTQFEATDARRCLPCWDEPAIRATFDVTLIYPSVIKTTSAEHKIVALSNMPEINTTIDADTGLRTTSFETTPNMSTYLLAVIVGPFDFVEKSDGRRPVRIYTTPGKKEQGLFALDVACKSLRFFEEYFSIDYPLPKMDLIAIPDFAAGAMENWGLVTYRETCLLVDPENTSTSVKQFAAMVIAHELSHQWFGNLVTMNWWTHLWLKEGFARFMQYLCVDFIFPEWDVFSQFVQDVYFKALNLDALHNSHPIEVPVNHPSEIDEIFDLISYEKGASVIRMLRNYIGDESFRTGLHQYLTKFAYSSALTEDLWDHLGAASGKPVRQVMSCWTAQKGFPWISVSTSKSSPATAQLSLVQGKFTADGTMPENEAGLTWMIPLNAITSADPLKQIDLGVLDKKETAIAIENANNDWVKLNPGTFGLYRTAYPAEMVERLASAIEDETLLPMDRLGIHSDFHALCQAGHINTVDLLNLLQAYKNETEYSVWASIDASIAQLQGILAQADFYDKFCGHIRLLFKSIHQKLGWHSRESDKYTDGMTRALVIHRLVSLGDDEVIEELLCKYEAHLTGSSLIPADLRFAAYRAVASRNNDDFFEGLFQLYRASDLQEERARILRAFGHVKCQKRIDRVIKFNMSDEVRNQDRMHFYSSFGAAHTQLGWDHFKENKDVLRSKYGTLKIMNLIISFIIKPFASLEKAQEVAEFFEENKFPGCERTIQQSLETIKLNANWLVRDEKSIRDHLLAN